MHLIVRVECGRQNETEGEEETQRAACKLAWLDPHPVVIMDTCACICVHVLERKEERKCERYFFALQTGNRDRYLSTPTTFVARQNEY